MTRKGKPCYKGGERHKFEPRYSRKTNRMSDRVTSIKGGLSVGELLELLTDQIYECDICVWCGKIVKKHELEWT